MTTQRQVSFRFPYLSIRVYVGGYTYEGDALLDTGFDGGISLPFGYLDDSVPSVGTTTWILADGSERDTQTYNGVLTFEGLEPFRVSVTMMGDEILIGTQAIKDFSVILDHGMRVIVEP